MDKVARPIPASRELLLWGACVLLAGLSLFFILIGSNRVLLPDSIGIKTSEVIIAVGLLAIGGGLILRVSGAKIT